MISKFKQKEANSETTLNNFIDINQFCELTGLKPSYVYKLTSKREIEYFKPFGGKIYFKLATVEKMFESSRITTSEEHEANAVNYVFNKNTSL